jgi:hypothetical protein
MLNWGAYSSFIQSHLVQAQYWHDPLQEETYKQYSQFIAVVNNDHEFNQTYKDNLEKLENLVLVKFAKVTQRSYFASIHIFIRIQWSSQRNRLTSGITLLDKTTIYSHIIKPIFTLKIE